MSGNRQRRPLRVLILSAVKHPYIARAILAHHRFQAVAAADDAEQPDWVHERNERLAAQYGVPYVTDPERAMRDFQAEVAVVSSEAERHADLTVRAASLGLHVVQDKPMSTSLAECDRIVQAIETNHVRFLMWNRSCLPSVLDARQLVQSGKIGSVRAIHVDFYFAKDAGPPLGTRQPDEPPMDWLEALKAAHATGADGGVGRRAMGELEVEGIYPLAYIHFVTGLIARRVFACTTSHFHQLHADHHVDDLATVSLDMDGGVKGSMSVGRIGRASHPDLGEIKIHVIGSEGELVIAESRPEVAVHYRDRPPLEMAHQRVAVDGDWLLADNFAQAIDTSAETLLDARTSRALTATVVAAIESGRTGVPVDVQHLAVK